MGGKAKKLPNGNPRRMTDFRCAWNGMSQEQRMNALEWVLNEARNPFLCDKIVVKDGMVLGIAVTEIQK